MQSDIKQFTNEELERINKADDLKISPFRADGKTYGTPTWIWCVVVEGNLYVRAYHGQNSKWYQSAMTQKSGRIHAAGMIKEVIFEPVDNTMHEKVDEAYKQKYASSQYFPTMISQRASTATVKILLL